VHRRSPGGTRYAQTRAAAASKGGRRWRRSRITRWWLTFGAHRRHSNCCGRAASCGARAAGLAFWFQPLSANLAEIPLDDRELAFLFHARTADFQEAVCQGVITYRVADPEALAARIDFSLDLETGLYVENAARPDRGPADAARPAARLGHRQRRTAGD
jgi:hypothetical protein